MTLPSPHFSPRAYLRFDREEEGKHEYLDGAIIAMAGGTPRHSKIAFNIAAALGAEIEARGCLGFTSDLRVAADPNRCYTHPDLTVVCGEPEYVDDDRDTITNPTLIVEVLSPSTTDYDRGAKAGMYRRIPSLQHLLLVAPEPAMVEHFQRLSDQSWRLDVIDSMSAVVELPAIGAVLAVSDIYRNTDRV